MKAPETETMDCRSPPVMSPVKLFADGLNAHPRFPHAFLMHRSKRTELYSAAFAVRSEESGMGIIKIT